MLYWLSLFYIFVPVKTGEYAVPAHRPAGDSLTVEVLNYDQLKPLLHRQSDTTYVVNFWATWCVPCVQELPHFLALDSIHSEDPFRLILVSLDFRKDYVSRLEPFVRERNLERYVVILDDQRSNYWIDDIDTTWSGAIPATLVYRDNRRTFFERTFHHVNELKDIVKPFLKL